MKWFKYIQKGMGLIAAYTEAAKDGVIDDVEIIDITKKVLEDFDIKIRITVKPVK